MLSFTRIGSLALSFEFLFSVQAFRVQGVRIPRSKDTHRNGNINASVTCVSQWAVVACAADGCHTCGARVEWWVNGGGAGSYQAAGQQVAATFEICGACGDCGSQWENMACSGHECYTCGDRVTRLRNNMGLSFTAAGQQVADEFNQECGGCGDWPSLTTVSLSLHTIPNAEQRLAVCNDGSPAGFFYAPPVTELAEEPPVWMLFQEGGWWCWDDESCRQRENTMPSYLMSSSTFASQIEIGAEMAEGRLGKSAHRIYLNYCTSDGYLGNRTGPLGWQFRGRSVLAATIEEMVALGMGSVAGSRLLYSGCSAGGRGAMYNIDWLQGLLPASVTLRGLLDSPLWIDLPALGPEQTSLRAQCEAMSDLHASALDEKCVQDHAGEPWRCLLAESSLSYVDVPSVVFAWRDDSWQVSNSFGHDNGPRTAEEHDWARALGERTVSTLTALPSRFAVFSSACARHCIMNGPDYNRLSVRGQTLQNVVEKFVFEDTAMRVIQQCDGFNCCTDR